MKDIAKKAEGCRICGEPLSLVLDLGNQALGCRYPAAGEEAPRAPLVLMRCEGCGLLQLSHSIVATELYRTDYGYRSGTTRTMRDHLRGVVIAADLTARTKPGDVVLDIGSNDGTLLGCWGDVVKVGIDPTAPDSYADALAVQSYFSAAAYFNVVEHKAMVVTSIAMLYDLDDPVDFALDVAAVLHPEGVWVIEVMYAGAMLAGAFDQVSHEHLTHLGLTSIRDILDRARLRVFDAEFNDMNGGTLRVMACHVDGPYRARRRRRADTDQIISEEARWDADRCAAFAREARTRADAVLDLVSDLSAAGRVIDVLGASQKGNTLLQFAKLGTSQIRRAVERDPAKVGRFTPGSGIPIVSEADTDLESPHYYLVLPWHFRGEIVKREAAFLDQGGHMIFPLPKIVIV